MNNLVIFYSQFMKADGSSYIGGIETYIHLLIKVFHANFNIKIVQGNKEKFHLIQEHYEVLSVGYINKKKAIKYIENELLKNEDDVFILASEQFSYKTDWINTIVIQHGVYWDLPVEIYQPKIKNRTLQQFYKIFDNYRNFKRIVDFKNVVCVDNNYINWFRALTGGKSDIKFYPILNCAGEKFFQIKQEQNSKEINILFARRFVDIRGVKLFVEVALKLINNYDNINIVIVGDGPKKEWLIEKLGHYDRVFFHSATYDEMPKVMSKSDIVVVPSLGSEGTSLSAIEAMAAGKAVVATNVGGLTNIIINNYNGFLCNISEQDLHEKIKLLIDNEDKRIFLGDNARSIALNSFTFSKWKEQWIEVVCKVQQDV